MGGELVRLLLEGGHRVRALVRPESPNAGRLSAGVEIFHGDSRDEAALVRSLEGVDTFVHVADVEHAPQVVGAARRTGVGRLVVVGSTSAHSAYAFRSGPKLAGERAIVESGLSWTVVRPTMIYGSELDKNIHRLLRFLARWPVYPVFGDGENLWQPVYYRDVAGAIVAALEREVSVGRAYDLPGARPLPYRDLVRVCAAAVGRRARLVHLPIEPVYRGLALAERAGMRLPVDSGQVLRLREDKAYPYEEASRDLGYSPLPFEEGVELEVRRLRSVGILP